MMWRTPVTQAFADALDGRRPAKGEVAELVAVATRLCEVAAEVEPSHEFRTALRTQLMASAVPVHYATRPARTGRRVVRSWAAVFAAMMATTFGAGMSAASADTIPGDTLYPVKRALESTQLATKYSDSSRGSFRLKLASERLGEVDQLTSVRTSSSELAAKTFAEFQRQASMGSDALLRSYLANDSRDDLATLNRFSAMSARQLFDMRAQLSAAQFEQAENLLDDVATQSVRLCQECHPSAAESMSNATSTSAAPSDAPSTTEGSTVGSTARVTDSEVASPGAGQPSASTSATSSASPTPKLSTGTSSQAPPVADLVEKTVIKPLEPLKDTPLIKGLSEQGAKLLTPPTKN